MPGGGHETVSNGFNLFVPLQPVPLDQSPQCFSKTSLMLWGHAPQAEKPLETVSTRPGPSCTALKRRC